VKEEKIKTKPINRLFKVFNADRIEKLYNMYYWKLRSKIPLPLIREVIDKLKDAKYFNKLDLIWRYKNVQIKKGDEWKASFITNKGLFKPKFIYFRLCNLLGTF